MGGFGDKKYLDNYRPAGIGGFGDNKYLDNYRPRLRIIHQNMKST